MKPAIERFGELPDVDVLDPDGLSDFLNEPGPALILFPGDPSRKPEVHDMAVVARELVKTNPSLRGALVELTHDREIRDRLGVNKVPSIAFSNGGKVVEVLGGIQDWANYARVVGRLVEETVNP